MKSERHSFELKRRLFGTVNAVSIQDSFAIRICQYDDLISRVVKCHVSHVSSFAFTYKVRDTRNTKRKYK